MKDDRQFYSLVEVAQMLGLSSITATKWLKAGKFIGVHRIGARRYVFEKDFKLREDIVSGRKIELLKRLVPSDTIDPNALFEFEQKKVKVEK